MTALPTPSGSPSAGWTFTSAASPSSAITWGPGGVTGPELIQVATCPDRAVGLSDMRPVRCAAPARRPGV